ncbi:FtsX-like permease family protein [uncultured Azohydromonas sp.]|jgi:ABC-type transport system, involved in lipoprotein release, permease component|uniref:ABC transporter permease n=1 Tax=uncultured Azohydromonas sp. TaxID=487342 RepID=UPI002634896E|nr:FtsX-like permease family protein [uncultured Azohydromonas sp.]
MSPFAWMRLAALNTLRNRRRSLVTVCIAALGTAALLLAGGFALYTYQSLEQAAARDSGHLVLGTPAQFEGEEDVPLQHGLDGVAELRRRLLADPDVRHVLPRVAFNGLVSNGEKSTVMMAVGIEPDSEFAIKGPFLGVSAGQVLTNADQGAVMLGAGLARNLKAGPGSGLTLLSATTQGVLNAMDVQVKGVFSTGIPEMDQRLVLTDVATAQKLLDTQRVSTLGVFLRGMEATAPAQARLQAAHPRLQVQTWLERAVFYRSVRALYNRIFGVMGLVIGVIVVFVVASAMAMAVVERTREIGTLRALGTLPRQLLRTLALEGLLLGGTGAVAGALLALAVSVALLVFPVQMPPPPGRSEGYPLQIAIEPTLYLGVLVLMLKLSTLAAALVARRTVRKPIVEALAHV